MPDLSKYDGTGDPRAHLKLYVGALCGHPDSEKLMLRFFQQSLTGPAALWLATLDIRPIKTWNDLAQEFIKQYRYNTELSLDRVYLMRVKQEPGESFRTYALRWKNAAMQVQPPLTDSEYAHTFVQTYKGVYYEQLCNSAGRSF